MSDPEVLIEDLTETDKRERSRIGFPYNDLDDAESVAQAIWANVASGSCDMAQLAGWLKHNSVNSGAFRLKVAAAKMFGLISTGQGAISLTKLGRDIVDPAKTAQARVEAFLTVPLYKELSRQYSGNLLPNAVGLEREIADMGVSTKQTDKARQVFMRSAQSAGFFKEGNNKLVRPGIASPADSGPSQEEESRGGGDGSGGGTMHPFVRGLVETLPVAGEPWPEEGRKEWLDAAAAIFKLIYRDATTARSPSTAQQQPSERSQNGAQD